MLTRRYYGNHKLSGVTARDVGGCRFVTAEDAGPGGVTLIAATAADAAGLPGAVAAVGELAAHAAQDSPGRRRLRRLGRPAGGPTRSPRRSATCVTARPLPAGVARITVTVAGASGAVMHHHFTFRPDGAGADGTRRAGSSRTG